MSPERVVQTAPTPALGPNLNIGEVTYWSQDTGISFEGKGHQERNTYPSHIRPGDIKWGACLFRFKDVDLKGRGGGGGEKGGTSILRQRR